VRSLFISIFVTIVFASKYLSKFLYIFYVYSNHYHPTKLKTKLLVTFTLFLLSIALNAQWVEKSNGLYGGTINVLFSDGDDLYAGTEGGGVFRSTNNGVDWTSISSGLYSNTQVSSFGASGSNLYVVLSENIKSRYIYYNDSRAFRSTDNGVSWTIMNTKPFISTVTSLAVSGNNLYAGSVSGRVFLSTDEGTTWIALNSGNPLNSEPVYSLVSSGNDLLAISGRSLYRSVDNGKTWVAILRAEDPIRSLAINGSSLYACTSWEVYRSTDNGGIWRYTTSGLNKGGGSVTIYSLAVDGSKLYAGTSDGVRLSVNDGIDWTHPYTGMPRIYTSVYSLIMHGSNLYAGSNDGIFRYTKDGDSLTRMNEGLTSTNIAFLTANENNLLVTTGNPYKNFISTDKGASWTSLDTVLPANEEKSLITCSAEIGGNLYIGVGYAGVFLSTNNGKSWSPVGSGLAGKTVYSLVTSGNSLFASTGEEGVYFLPDKGTTWTAINAGLANWSVGDLAVSGNNLYAGTRGGGVFLSTNNGASWTEINTGLPSQKWVRSLAASGSYLYAVLDYGFYRSSNNGTSWTVEDLGLDDAPSTPRVNCLAVNGGNVYVGTENGVYISTDNGDNWTAANFGLKNTSIGAIAVKGLNLYVGTRGAGVWAVDVTTGDIKEVVPNITIFPNPVGDLLQFHGITEEVKSTQLFDMTGRASLPIVLEKRNNIYQASAGHLSPGEYVLRILLADKVAQVRFVKK
jgi:photosystem II stability/assembly factor-like uncharacterized protein